MRWVQNDEVAFGNVLDARDSCCPNVRHESEWGAVPETKQLASRTIGKMHIESFGAAGALFWVSQDAHVPVGVEAVFDHDTEPTVDIDFPGGTVADLLNMVVSQAPEYRWIEDEGIVHAYWKSTHLPIGDIMISYPGVRNKTREQVWDEIVKRPEVSGWLDANHCERNDFFTGKEFRNHNGPISIEPGSRTLAQLLDEVAIKSGENYWAIIQTPETKPCRVNLRLW